MIRIPVVHPTPEPAPPLATRDHMISIPVRFPQLDALRAFAVATVLLCHFSPSLASLYPELGFVGVSLFFVLSGFLITGILLRAQDAMHRGQTTLRAELIRFFSRRSLRILPAFYLLLLANALLDIGSTRRDFWWHAAYLSNVLMGLDGHWRDLVTHLWSLAVEEQFYFIWPWIVLGVARRSFATAMLGMIAIGPLFRLGAFLLVPHNVLAPIVLTPSCLDLLGIGALLAWLRHTRGERDPARNPWRIAGLVLLPFALAAPLILPAGSLARVTLVPVLQAFAFAALIDGAALGFTGICGRILAWAPLLWIGRISYGIYLYHNNAHWLGPRVLRQLTHYRMAYFSSETLHVLYLSLLSIAAATVSWFVLERPLNILKDRLASTRPES